MVSLWIISAEGDRLHQRMGLVRIRCHDIHPQVQVDCRVVTEVPDYQARLAGSSGLDCLESFLHSRVPSRSAFLPCEPAPVTQLVEPKRGQGSRMRESFEYKCHFPTAGQRLTLCWSLPYNGTSRIRAITVDGQPKSLREFMCLVLVHATKRLHGPDNHNGARGRRLAGCDGRGSEYP